MRALVLFSGTRSIEKVLQAQGHETVSLDIDPTFGPDLCMSILDFDETAFAPDHFDFVWASPCCQAYSRARTKAKISRDVVMTASDKLVVKTRQIIAHFHDALWVVENPATSLMWMREASGGLGADSVVTSYCCWGTLFRKDTRLANNFGLSLPRCPGAPTCPAMIGQRHVEWSQRGCGGAVPRFKTRHELHAIPGPLVEEIVRQLNAALAAPRGERGPGWPGGRRAPAYSQPQP